ncbi:MAG: hypothetical protein R3Y04_03350 [Rikenellaceae bacterium]
MMKNEYIAPQIEVIEIELESQLCGSGGLESLNFGGSIGDWEIVTPFKFDLP